MIPRNDRYQQMCMQAQEIQDLWKREYGDQYLTLQHDSEYLIMMKRSENDAKNLKHPCFWLPSQRDLQQITLEGFGGNIFGMLHHFIMFVRERFLPLDQDTIIEELWLRYVMMRKFGKIWNDEQWVVP